MRFYGDAVQHRGHAPGPARATHLIITLPHSANRNPLIAAAKLINPSNHDLRPAPLHPERKS